MERRQPLTVPHPRDHRPHLLVTGFVPFGMHAVNPSGLLVPHIASDGILTAVLPVDRERSVETVVRLIDRVRPSAFIGFGLNARSDTIVVERTAANLDAVETEVGGGAPRLVRPIDASGPDVYRSTLPVHAIVDALTSGGFPAVFGDDAGTFVCNHLFYRVRHRLESGGRPIPAGFVHIPPLPEQIDHQPDRTGMTLDRLIAAARIVCDVVTACLVGPVPSEGRRPRNDVADPVPDP